MVIPGKVYVPLAEEIIFEEEADSAMRDLLNQYALDEGAEVLSGPPELLRQGLPFLRSGLAILAYPARRIR